MRTLTIWKGREWEGKGSGGRTKKNEEGREREGRWCKKRRDDARDNLFPE